MRNNLSINLQNIIPCLKTPRIRKVIPLAQLQLITHYLSPTDRPIQLLVMGHIVSALSPPLLQRRSTPYGMIRGVDPLLFRQEFLYVITAMVIDHISNPHSTAGVGSYLPGEVPEQRIRPVLHPPLGLLTTLREVS